MLILSFLGFGGFMRWLIIFISGLFIGLILRFILTNLLFPKNKSIEIEPFKGKPLLDSDTTFEQIYDISNDFGADIYSHPIDFREKWGAFLNEHEIEVFRGELTIKGRQIRESNEVVRMFLIGGNFIIIWDRRDSDNVHAYSLNGDHIWTIEPCLIQGRNIDSFSNPFGIKKMEGKDLLMLSEWPLVFATDLHTGKGTFLWEVDDYREWKKNAEKMIEDRFREYQNRKIF